MSVIKIIVIDDHLMVLEGLRQFFDAYSDIRLIGTASSTDRGLALANELQPDIAIVDLNLPGTDLQTPDMRSRGVQLIAQLRRRFPSMGVLALTGYPSPFPKEAAIKAGAHGFLYKNCMNSEIVEAIRRVSRGEILHDPDLCSPTQPLTNRELEVFHLTSLARTDRQIADQLHISYSTVVTHQRNIHEKLNISSRVEATQMAFCQPIFESDEQKNP